MNAYDCHARQPVVSIAQDATILRPRRGRCDIESVRSQLWIRQGNWSVSQPRATAFAASDRDAATPSRWIEFVSRGVGLSNTSTPWPQGRSDNDR